MPQPRAYRLAPNVAYIPPTVIRRPRRIYDTPVNFGGFGSLGGGTSCGCELPATLATATGIESMIKAHPVLWVAGAFLLGYSLKGR